MDMFWDFLGLACTNICAQMQVSLQLVLRKNAEKEET